jgi:HSP20 family molecular chaperone IbpA
MSSNSDNMNTTTNQEQFQQVSKKFKKPYKKRNTSDGTNTDNTTKPKLSFKELLFELNNLKKYKHSPKADLFERNNSYVIKMELPGLTQNDITVQLRDSQFVLVSGHKHNLVNQSDDTIIYSECFYGNFMRRVKVPQPVSKDSMNLSMNNGVLFLTFNKLPQVEETLDARLDETPQTQALEPIPEGKVLDFSSLGDFKSTSWADEI